MREFNIIYMHVVNYLFIITYIKHNSLFSFFIIYKFIHFKLTLSYINFSKT
jgi:hypothetical protein